MFNQPGENRVQWTRLLSEQFLCKGYQCQEVNERDATVLILTTDKKIHADLHTSSVSDRSYEKTRII